MRRSAVSLEATRAHLRVTRDKSGQEGSRDKKSTSYVAPLALKGEFTPPFVCQICYPENPPDLAALTAPASILETITEDTVSDFTGIASEIGRRIRRNQA